MGVPNEHYYIRKRRTITDVYEVYRTHGVKLPHYVETDGKLISSHRASVTVHTIEGEDFRAMSEPEIALALRFSDGDS